MGREQEQRQASRSDNQSNRQDRSSQSGVHDKSGRNH